VLLDAEMPGMSGLQIRQALKTAQALADVPVIFITSRGEADAAGFEIGAADFISKPVSASLVRALVKSQLLVKRKADEWRRTAEGNPITG
jgi:DNA-binding response OmpR family regulator